MNRVDAADRELNTKRKLIATFEREKLEEIHAVKCELKKRLRDMDCVDIVIEDLTSNIVRWESRY